MLDKKKVIEQKGDRARRKLYQHLEPYDFSKPLSFFIRNVYAAPSFATLPVTLLLSVYSLTFYESLGAQLSYISFFIALARSLDVLIDPFMSYLTDSYRSEHGRRRPFNFLGSFLYALMLNLLLSPPSTLSSSGVSLWFGVSYVGFFLSNSLMTIPYDALGPELTDSYEDRAKLFFTVGMYDGIGALIAIIQPGFIGKVLDFDPGSCSNDSCIGDNGLGYSCMAAPGTSIITTYHVVNMTQYKRGEGNCFPFLSDTRKHNKPVSTAFSSGKCDALSGLNSTATHNSCLATYCQCVQECISLCSVKLSRSSYSYIGFFFGAWIVVTMVNMCYWIKERSMIQKGLKLEETPPIVPTILNTFRNRAFTSLLPAWVLDSCSFALISSMMAYYVKYVIQPEYQTKKANGIDCNQGVPVIGQESDSWKCKSDIILGAIVSIMLITAFACCPIWLLLTQKFEKIRAWLGMSLTMAISIGLFGFVGEGDVIPALGVAVLAGIPLGAKFLNDAILADIIDYDEFLTGQRNEATYTMFKSFLPKICSIPAAAIPLAILSASGYVSPVNGQVQRQPPLIKLVCQFSVIVVPCLLSILSFFVKLRFPLRKKFQIDMIASGVGLHLIDQSAPDPLTGLEFIFEAFSEEERQRLYNIDNFPRLDDAINLKCAVDAKVPHLAVNRLISRSRNMLFFSFLCLVLSGVGVTKTYADLNDPTASIEPILCIIALGMSITAMVFCLSRFRAAVAMLDPSICPTSSMLTRLIHDRRMFKKINDTKQILLAPIVEKRSRIRPNISKLGDANRFFQDLSSDSDDEATSSDDEVKVKAMAHWNSVLGSFSKNANATKVDTGPTVWDLELLSFVKEQSKAIVDPSYVNKSISTTTLQSKNLLSLGKDITNFAPTSSTVTNAGRNALRARNNITTTNTTNQLLTTGGGTSSTIADSGAMQALPDDHSDDSDDDEE